MKEKKGRVKGGMGSVRSGHIPYQCTQPDTWRVSRPSFTLPSRVQEGGKEVERGGWRGEREGERKEVGSSPARERRLGILAGTGRW